VASFNGSGISPHIDVRDRAVDAPRAGFLARRQRSYYFFIVPALVVIGAVIVFPWLFTLWMSAFDWKIGSAAHFVGFEKLPKARHQPAVHRIDCAHVLFHGACGDHSARAWGPPRR
jgi:hypothetical protein